MNTPDKLGRYGGGYKTFYDPHKVGKDTNSVPTIEENPESVKN